MSLLLPAVAIIVCVYMAYEFFRIAPLVWESEALIKKSQAFSRVDGKLSLLVLGDSTAAGVGSPTEGSVAARLSAYLDASVENYAVSGAKVQDLGVQFAKAKKERFDVILIQAGANNVIRLRSLSKAEKDMDALLHDARKRSERVVLLTSGRIGKAPFFPFLLRHVLTNRSANLRKRFMKICERNNAAYVDLFSASRQFNDDQQRYFAKDHLHLSGDGYGVWFEEVKKTIDVRWPDFHA